MAEKPMLGAEDRTFLVSLLTLIGLVARNGKSAFFGVIHDLFTKLMNDPDGTWFTELKKFLRKEPCWVGETIQKGNEFLHSLSAGQQVIIGATDGTENLADANDVFSSIDSDLKNWGLNVKGKETTGTPVEVLEMVKNGNFQQIFGSFGRDLDSLCLTQHQIKRFVKDQKTWLRTDRYTTFFLFKENGEYFVARVYLSSGGVCGVYVSRLSCGDVWGAVVRRRFVVPQQTPGA